MKIAFLSGAYKNAGDFLIENRAMDLLRHVYPNIEILKILRNKIAENIDDINHCDCIVFGGGPIYKKELDGYLPLDICIEKMRDPITVLGGGWYGAGNGIKQISNYKFTSKTRKFFQRILDGSGGGLSCRDIISYQVLKNHGFERVYMTGCPAWYDLNRVHSCQFKEDGPIKKIVISDPAQKRNFKGCLKLVDFAVNKFRNAEVIFAFHRDSYESFRNKLASRQIKTIDISGSSDGFRIYNDCDMHIGYRVHAHIYNLSIRNKSILIEEDGRGAGVNQALGLPQIKAYNDQIQSGNDYFCKVYKRMPFYENEDLINQLDIYLDILEATGYQYMINAFKMQQIYYESMISFIENIMR